ncbi:DoxX family membrane protein [Chryseobacterium sp. Leaf201]|uniref:DoxX family membrane protein n=1 Tax=Chryseobacterium sp. Leaf201 TaxID=1735672 RepID=UPI0006F4B18B|nr:DoxX family membrane protein [Chryseobacterium sp. Leaf201]KQM24954.1 DoxX family protein [Chryseobacterium sp. Leaf201]
MNFQQLRTNRTNQWIIIHLRYLIGFAFIPSGLVKVMGHRFTTIQTDNPVGYFFEALYQSGMYWNFLGWVQLIAGILLITQRYATLGALMFFAILSNIWIITLSMSFNGTWIITSLMMFAVMILLIWDRHKLLPIINYKTTPMINEFPDPARPWVNAGIVYAVCFTAICLLGAVRDNMYAKWLSGILVSAVLANFIISNYRAYRSSKLIVNA